MRTIVFKQGEYGTDPVNVGDILRIRRGNKWHTAIAVNEVELFACTGCLFAGPVECGVPTVTGSETTLCNNARCVFKELDEVLEDL